MGMGRYLLITGTVVMLSVLAFTAVGAQNGSQEEAELERLYAELEEIYQEIIDNKENLGRLDKEEARHIREMLNLHARNIDEYMEYCADEGAMQYGHMSRMMGTRTFACH